MTVSTGCIKLPTDVVHSDETASSYPQVFETWDSVELEPQDADAVAVAMSKDSADVINDNAPDKKDVAETWDSAKLKPKGTEAVAMTTGKNSAGISGIRTPEVEEFFYTCDSEDEEDAMNRNSCEK